MQDTKLYSSKQINLMVNYSLQRNVTLATVNRWLQDFEPETIFGKTKYYTESTVEKVLASHDVIGYMENNEPTITVPQLLAESEKWSHLESDSEAMDNEINAQNKSEESYRNKLDEIQSNIEMRALIFGIAEKLDVRIDRKKLEYDVTSFVNDYIDKLDPKDYIIK
ncbi:hypothetical protein N2E94_09195 [Leuconostoc citreum]